MSEILGQLPFINLNDLKERYRSLETDKGAAAGTFIEVVPNYLYVATGTVKRGGVRVKQGTWFVRDERLSSNRVLVFRSYDNAYNVIRGYGTHAKGWGMFQLSSLHSLHSLAMADLAGTWFLQTMSVEQYEKLVEKCSAILNGKGTTFTKDKKVRHAIEKLEYGRTGVDNRSRKRLVFTNAAGKIAERIRDVTGSYDVIVTLSTVTAQYMGAVLNVVRKERAKVDAMMALGTDALFDEKNAHALLVIGKRLFDTFVARPTTHVGDRASKDCMRAADLIRVTIPLGKDGRAGASEGVRNLLGNVRDSLDLLLWQYDVAEVVALIATPVRNKTPFTAEEWVALYARVTPLHRRIKPPFGSRFENGKAIEDAVLNIGIAATLALAMTEHFDPATSVKDLANVKSSLVGAMRCA